MLKMCITNHKYNHKTLYLRICDSRLLFIIIQKFGKFDQLNYL